MSKQERMVTLSLDDLRSLISRTVEETLDEKVLFDQDRALGRCPYCHGRDYLIDPVLHDKVPCICTGVDPSTILGVS